MRLLKAFNLGSQRRIVEADCMGRIVYQYHGQSFHLFLFMLISNFTQLVSRSLAYIEAISFLSLLIIMIAPDISLEIKAKWCILEIVNTVQTNNPQIFGTKPAFNGGKNIFSFTPLSFSGDEGIFSCKL